MSLPQAGWFDNLTPVTRDGPLESRECFARIEAFKMPGLFSRSKTGAVDPPRTHRCPLGAQPLMHRPALPDPTPGPASSPRCTASSHNCATPPSRTSIETAKSGSFAPLLLSSP
ncbi:hypothetical protein BDY21DRAFT_212202 [Lineolata rhizophorae]|uniref:Uncharacterized protein n=1 Tax=Lineolata rhizophorae TaxID=578093 RepID=A0A6A6P4T7_9PEZI|nr:hypothetical protein BDY21DRAFT_212202 [Lineolata rhizophorae]